MAELNATDTNRPVRIESALGGDLLVKSMTGEDQMGRLFTYHLSLLSENKDLLFKKVVGQQVTVILGLSSGEERFFNGFITDFSYTGSEGPYMSYQATVRPWFWFLTRTADCKIFQNMKVPDIIKAVFRDNGMSDFKESLNGTYREWDYCVQYRESDFNFISRLMEQEGIYYYFEHTNGKHELVMVDGPAAHKVQPGYSNVYYRVPEEGVHGEYEEHLDSWKATQSIMPDKCAVQDFNFTIPKVSLLKKSSKNTEHANQLEDSEIYDYPGEYPLPGDGTNYVKIRLEELQSKKETVWTGGTCRGITVGSTFNFNEYPRDDQNKEYLVLSVNHLIENSAFYGGQSSAEMNYRCTAEVSLKSAPFRTSRVTPKPMVQGPQTAFVVGPAGDEIYTDDFGRVKIQFHWDRYGELDENSSCWVRVSQIWAGAKWGGIHIPRIGQEVVVSFIEGDPDRPLITGSVYNANTMPPYTLEGSKTQSGIKSRSTPDGGSDNFNEIRMEDKIGEEELYIQAEKNENILVKNNKGETVGNNETISIGNDREESVGNDETISVGHDRQESVANDETLTVSNNRTRNVGVNETIDIGSERTHTVGANETISIGANQSTDIKGAQSIGVGGDRAADVGGSHSVSVGASEERTIGSNLVINVADSILLSCGGASISLKSNGDIKIDGKNLIFKSAAKASVKASGSIILKGSKILGN